MSSLVACVAALLSAAGADAATQRFELQSGQIITNPEGHARMLLDFGDLSTLEGEWITSARVSVDLSDAELASNVNLELYGVGSSWTAGTATWSSPWTEPGGDLEDWNSSEEFVVAGRGRVRIDATEMVRQLVSEEVSTDGFMLVASGPERDGILPAELTRLGGTIPVVLEVTYRKVSAIGVRVRR